MILPFVTKVAEVEVDVVKAVEGGKSKASIEAHQLPANNRRRTKRRSDGEGRSGSTHSNQLPADNLRRTKRRSDGEARSGCSDVSTSAHALSVSDKVPEVAGIG
jgi:hypothetical protein